MRTHWFAALRLRLRYAQDERENIPLWVRKYTNLLWFDLDSSALHASIQLLALSSQPVEEVLSDQQSWSAKRGGP